MTDSRSIWSARPTVCSDGCHLSLQHAPSAPELLPLNRLKFLSR